MGIVNDGQLPLEVRVFNGLQDYATTLAAMREWTAARQPDTTDQIWLLEHFPVLTLGQAGRPEHILVPSTIPIIQSDRGGQVTYHAPGQLVAYVLLDLQRRGIGIKRLVELLEQSVIDLLALKGVIAERRISAPGVYVANAKIAALGLRVRRGCTYHGLALNVAMNLAPFAQINPCGYAGLRITQLADLVTPQPEVADVGQTWVTVFSRLLAAHQQHSSSTCSSSCNAPVSL
ncbi:lipoyl(octanoyl) transferase LipB [Chromatium okenii]|uniref:Octanoyltransferase n=1 Tax=Chromatium okenii TaxID=61644 RepID=A0A2S7XN60_9GAMM|nr:lipoyl(octanoyl) transferase LipB [Chromatium okenii]MBV5311268.1 lipoyl(octanoyl) transferase LipB [Chromatium okenii]PQJ95165.1 octanoyltransferase [Chromatium okenii]PQJ97651.1 octanoyltransferase [Chromatium okenii]